jgi:hypothetical protein
MLPPAINEKMVQSAAPAFVLKADSHQPSVLSQQLTAKR